MTHKQLKKWRKKLGWTQEFAAFLINMPYETYRSLETGRRTMPKNIAQQIGNIPRISQQTINNFNRFKVSQEHLKYRRTLKKEELIWHGAIEPEQKSLRSPRATA